jgi:two-component system, cell cycle sensor histidine kinase and response regulator CckA
MDATSQIQGATALAPPAAQEAPSTPRAPSSTPDTTTSPQIVPFRARPLEDTSARRQMEERLRQAEKMELIGRLTSGVAHDFNNLLTGILLYSDLLLAELSPDSSLHRYVQEVRLACEQGAALTKQLLAVARKQGSEAQAIGINEVVARMENLLRHMIGEQIELVTALDPAAGTVVADATQLRQILLNLVLNARDALACGRVTGGKIRVGTRLSEWPHNVLDDRRELAILLTVEDSGCGMSAEICAHLFEPFFTTKKAGEGTGLGLGTVQRIVGELGGAIEVASAPGSGTRIQIFLPKAQESGESGSPESVPAKATVLDGTEGQPSAAADTQVLNRIVNTPK